MGKSFFLSSKKGFTLAEVMVAMGISTVMIGVLMQMSSNMAKMSAIGLANSDRQSLYQEINRILSDSQLCTTALQGQPVPSANQASDIRFVLTGNNRVLQGNGGSYGRLQFSHIQLRDIQQVPPASGNLYTAMMEIGYSPLFKSYQLIPGEFPVYFSQGAGSVIDTCYGSNLEMEDFCESIGGAFDVTSQSCDITGHIRRQACLTFNGNYDAASGICNGGNFNSPQPQPPRQPASSCGGSNWISGRCAQGQRVLQWSGTSQSQCWQLCQASRATCCAWSAHHGGRCSRDSPTWPLQHRSNAQWVCR